MERAFYLVIALVSVGIIFTVIYLSFRSPHRSKTNNILFAIFTTFGIWIILAAGSAAFSEEFLMGLVFLVIGVVFLAIARVFAKRKKELGGG